MSTRQWRWIIRFCDVIIIFQLGLSIGHSMAYDEETYNCEHMSRDIEDVFESIGIDTKFVIGYNTNRSDMEHSIVNGTDTYTGKGHAWLRINGIDIDAVALCVCPCSLMFSNIEVFDDHEDFLEKYPSGRVRIKIGDEK